MPLRTPCEGAARRHGVTLIELLVVLSIAALLLGGGAAMFAALDRSLAIDGVAQQVRTALASARARALAAQRPTFVLLDFQDGTVTALEERTVGLWHFEADFAVTPRTVAGFRGHVFNLVNSAGLVRDGRIGWGLELADHADSAECPQGRAFAFTEGLRVSCWVWWPSLFQDLEPYDALGTIVELPGVFRLAIEESSGPAPLPVFVGELGAVPLEGQRPVLHDRWYQLELSFDGREARLFVDGAEQRFAAIAPEDDPLGARPVSLHLGHGPGGGGYQSFIGVLDEFQISALSTTTDGYRLPPAVRLEPAAAFPWDSDAVVVTGTGPAPNGSAPNAPQGPAAARRYATVAFDRAGALDPRFHRAPVRLRVRRAATTGTPLVRPIGVTLFGLVE